jgi:hypothetical protein
MVDKLDEGGVQADEGETVQFAAAWTLATPHRVDDRTQPRKSRTVERPFDNDGCRAESCLRNAPLQTFSCRHLAERRQSCSLAQPSPRRRRNAEQITPSSYSAERGFSPELIKQQRALSRTVSRYRPARDQLRRDKRTVLAPTTVPGEPEASLGDRLPALENVHAWSSQV